jgi:hypothetical protein
MGSGSTPHIVDKMVSLEGSLRPIKIAHGNGVRALAGWLAGETQATPCFQTRCRATPCPAVPRHAMVPHHAMLPCHCPPRHASTPRHAARPPTRPAEGQCREAGEWSRRVEGGGGEVARGVAAMLQSAEMV